MEILIVLRVTIICNISLFEIILSCCNHRQLFQNKNWNINQNWAEIKTSWTIWTNNYINDWPTSSSRQARPWKKLFLNKAYFSFTIYVVWVLLELQRMTFKILKYLGRSANVALTSFTKKYHNGGIFLMKKA